MDLDGSVLVRVKDEEARDRAISEILAQKGQILSVIPQRESLEDVFAREIR